MNISINRQNIAVQGIRELRAGITVEQAVQKTRNNGLDEVFFKSNGRTYVAYGDALKISDLRKNEIPAVMFNHMSADIIAYDDEANSYLEGAMRGATEEIGHAVGFVRGAVSNLLRRVGPTVAGAAGVGAVGMGLYTVWKRSQVGAIGTALSAQGGAVGVATGSKVVSGLVGGIKTAAIAGLAGAGILAAYGALKGALEVKATTKDYSSIASIVHEGSTPSNGGAAISWSELNSGTSNYTPPAAPVTDAPAQPVTPPVSSEPVDIGFGFSEHNRFQRKPPGLQSPATLMNPSLLRR